jgi:hypothetical protein
MTDFAERLSNAKATNREALHVVFLSMTVARTELTSETNLRASRDAIAPTWRRRAPWQSKIADEHAR